MAGSGSSVSTGDEGRVGATRDSRIFVFLAHEGALRDKKYDVDTDEYWNHMAKEVGKSVEEVKEYWVTTTTYRKYYKRLDTPRREESPQREEKEEKAEEKEEKPEEKDEKAEGGDEATKK
ncbi:hypothetical protein ACHQM5_030098 [Ranunculus cassubicifolius]